MKDEIKEILEYAKSKGYIDLDYEESKLLFDYITNLQESEAYYYGHYKDYILRIDKAIEYINDNFYDVDFKYYGKDLLNILEGEDK